MESSSFVSHALIAALRFARNFVFFLFFGLDFNVFRKKTDKLSFKPSEYPRRSPPSLSLTDASSGFRREVPRTIIAWISDESSKLSNIVEKKIVRKIIAASSIAFGDISMTLRIEMRKLLCTATK